MPTKKSQNEIVSFYGGQVQIEIKPWGDHFRYIKVGTKGGTLSATAITKNLDKSKALLPWAINLVGTHITSTIENSSAQSFGKEEICSIVREAVLKPDEAKVKGGDAGTLIHDFAHEFAKAKINGTPTPTLDHLDENNEVHAKAINGINGFLDWYNENEVEFLYMEKLVYYNSFYAGDTKEGEDLIEFLGIMDLLARVNEIIELVDYKTSKGVYSDQRYQVSGYFKAWNTNAENAMQAQSTLILNFNKETGDKIEKRIPSQEVELDFKAFKGLQAVAIREKELDEEYRNSKK